MSQLIKLFEMNDCDYYAGATIEECIAAYMKEFNVSGEYVESAREVTAEQMSTLVFYDDVLNSRHSFQEQLNLMIQSGRQFPCFFATTEY